MCGDCRCRCQSSSLLGQAGESCSHMLLTSLAEVVDSHPSLAAHLISALLMKRRCWRNSRTHVRNPGRGFCKPYIVILSQSFAKVEFEWQ